MLFCIGRVSRRVNARLCLGSSVCASPFGLGTCRGTRASSCAVSCFRKKERLIRAGDSESHECVPFHQLPSGGIPRARFLPQPEVKPKKMNRQVNIFRQGYDSNEIIFLTLALFRSRNPEDTAFNLCHTGVILFTITSIAFFARANKA
jgi:hypothetical protein